MSAQSTVVAEERTRSWPVRGWLGLLLIAIFWKAPPPQDDDLQAPEIDIDPDDFL